MPYPNYIADESFNIYTDADIRSVTHDILYGTSVERPRGRWVVIQKLLRDADNSPLQSSYTYKLTGEGRDKNRGPNTTRTGFLCTESLARVMYRPASRMILDDLTMQVESEPPTRDIVYLSSENPVEAEDIICLISIDDDGNIVNPVRVLEELIVTKVYAKTLDGGRIEYYAAIVEDQK